MNARSRNVGALLSRIAAAVLGGYLLANLGALALAYLNPAAFASMLMGGMMVGFILYLLAVMWVFAAATARRAWAGIALPALVCALVIVIGKWRAQA